ncbi:aldo/keto reductase [Pseudomonas typographi]|uniref:Aldo/keto reductase n=1 Tax=Pseudomonas typographi TaxID=2715964 RepID=A0ABR7YZJ7_9PSED|nr:aldo/keto reductase [Pseudomonas typographi]MBD1586736.1 aldo/keto reductase [Pseudomonas typographi]MBD1598630.1 aldo/keto reductase [Pseudomonas typographi]
MPTRRQLIQMATATAALHPLLSRAAWGAELIQRPIPTSGERLPIIGLGTSRTFDVNPNDGPAMAPLREVMQAFVGGGARLIDTAPSYGQAEAASGELVHSAGLRDRVFLATKVSASGQEAGARQIEASFEALQTERIDLVQVHNLVDTATHLATLRALKAAGRVRYIGVTHYLESAQDRLAELLRQEPVDFVQFNYSVSERNAEKRLLPLCADKGIAVLANRPFGAGRLFPKVQGQPVPAWAQVELQASSWAQLMLKFVLANPAVTVVIPATSNPRYMLDNLLAGQGALPDAAQRARIVQVFA